MGHRTVKVLGKITAETWLTALFLALGALGTIFMGQLVAEPKVLFGRSLTAIPPSLFPSLVLGALAALAALRMYQIRSAFFSTLPEVAGPSALGRVVMLFAVMFFYAFTMNSLGFLISSALSMAAVSWIAGNRSVVQICLVSLFSPIALYLISTRGLAVALPELSAIEFFYARVFDW
ncbi:MAG: tripartite tricarboxylate transporter TctB family protein [Pseudomonadota bacterium]